MYLARTIKNEMQTNRCLCRVFSSSHVSILPLLSPGGAPVPSHYVPYPHARTHARTLGHTNTYTRTRTHARCITGTSTPRIDQQQWERWLNAMSTMARNNGHNDSMRWNNAMKRWSDAMVMLRFQHRMFCHVDL